MKRGMLVALVVMVIGSVALAQDVKVLVLPFEAVGPDQGTKGWVARALQQNLTAELSGAGTVRVMSGSATPGDTEMAGRVGEASEARYVVFGSYQAVGTDL